jgi:ADP-ribose pyrophosphatase
MTDLKPWRTLQTTMLLDSSPWIRVYADDVLLPDGRVIEGYLRLESPGYAMIVPVSHDNQIGLIRSYKRGVDAIDLQPPAGMIEAGEDPLITAKRELYEELGCNALEWISMGKYVVGGNFGVGQAHFFLAKDCQQVVEPESGDLEEQETVWLPLEKARQWWIAGTFRQMASAAALGLAFAHLEDDQANTPSTNKSKTREGQ